MHINKFIYKIKKEINRNMIQQMND